MHLRISLFTLVLLSACASKPQFYPNEKLKTVGKEGAEKDTESCQKLADEYMTSGKGRDIASGAGKGAAVGAATGGVLGIFSKNILGGALIGGAVGTAAGGTSSALSPDKVRRNFVDHCLQERGYHVVGWD